MRIVLDANVLVAAFGARGLCEALMEVCLQSHRIVLSEHLLEESRVALVKKFATPPSLVDEILGFLREHVELVEPAPVEADRCRDPDDRPVLGTVLAGAAELLVSGDRDLLVLGSFGDASIVTPRECYERLR